MLIEFVTSTVQVWSGFAVELKIVDYEAGHCLLEKRLIIFVSRFVSAARSVKVGLALGLHYEGEKVRNLDLSMTPIRTAILLFLDLQQGKKGCWQKE